MNESEAKAALLEMGIKKPSRSLLQDYIRAQERTPSLSPQGGQEQSGETPPRPSSSKSNLKPLLVEREELVRQRGPRRAGRPRVQAIWFPALATRMADGTLPMRKALASLGIHLSEREIRSLYRNRTLSTLRREAREKWQREWGIRSRTKTRRHKGCRGDDCLGFSRELRQIL